MADGLPSLTQKVVTSEAPQSRLSGSDIAQPYEMMAKGLDQLGEGLEKVAEPMAEQAGLKSVSTDPQGNLVVTHAPIFGEAGAVYARAQKFSALSQGEAAARQQDLALSQKFPNDPQGYLTAANAFRDKLVDQYSKVSPEVGMALHRSIDNNTSNNYRFLVLQHQRNIRDNFDTDTKSAIKSKMDDIESILATGGADNPAGRKQVKEKWGEIERLYHERVNNPILAAPPGQAADELKALDERVGAARFTSEVNNILKNPKGGVGLATDYVEGVMSRQDMSPNQRTINYAHGLAAIKDYTQNLEREANLNQKAQKQKDQLFEGAVIQSTDAGTPLSEHQIKTSDASPESKMRMLAWVKRDGLPEPLAHVSQVNAMDLFRRMNLPDGDPQKITDLSPIREAYAPTNGSRGNITRSDEEWLEKRFTEGRSPNGERLDKLRQELSKAAAGMLDSSTMMKIDGEGKLRTYSFERYVDQKIDEYRQNKKNPLDLFDPTKSDFLGKPEVINNFSTPLNQQVQNKMRNMGIGNTTPGSSVIPATPSAKPQRQPGESVNDFLKRTGG